MIRIKAVGDLFLGDTTTHLGHGVRSRITSLGVDHYSSEIAAQLRDSDLSFANLECVMSDLGRIRWRVGTVELRGAPEHFAVIQRSGIKILNTANNHILQHGLAAYEETLSRIRQSNIHCIGMDDSGRSNVVQVTIKGVSTLWVGFSMRPERRQRAIRFPYSCRSTYDEVLAEISTIRSAYHGHLVCSLHWGDEFLDTPQKQQQVFARAAIDAGVTLIVGHHPHVLQGIEEYKQGLVAYSLGNYVFDLNHLYARESVILSVDLSAAGIESYRIIPLVIDKDYCPRICSGSPSTQILERVEKFSAQLRAGRSLSPEQAREMNRMVLRRHRVDAYVYFFRSITRYHILHSLGILLRSLARKIGLLHNP